MLKESQGYFEDMRAKYSKSSKKLDVPLFNIQLSPVGEVNSAGYIPRRKASRYISTALHRP